MHGTNAKPAQSRKSSGTNINETLRTVQDPHTPKETKDHALRRLDGLEGRPAHAHAKAPTREAEEGHSKDGSTKLIKRRPSEKQHKRRDDQGDPKHAPHETRQHHGEPKRVNFTKEPGRDGEGHKAFLHRDGHLLSKQ
ncbi:hypothetical protein EW145_g4024 [Phellinidium pouzarii]|uniref:Uncharacterized protein n=1 Tax=Phellinidium pouzarii TaxID=167371 RepID=A0A4S4L587_9AGAM|nr:hypothetical protein EW145_g4024 [Phellinidium pouzarii]